MAADVFGAADGIVACDNLGNKAGFCLQGLPHVAVEGSFGDVAEDLDFVVGYALQWCRSDIEQRAQPRREQVDVDLIDTHVDAVNQRGEHRTPACRWQLRPFPSNIRGSRDQTLMR